MLTFLFFFLWVMSFSIQSISWLAYDVILHQIILAEHKSIVDSLIPNFDQLTSVQREHNLIMVYQQQTGLYFDYFDILRTIYGRGDIEMAKEIYYCGRPLRYYGDSWNLFLKSYVEAQLRGVPWVPDYSLLDRD